MLASDAVSFILQATYFQSVYKISRTAFVSRCRAGSPEEEAAAAETGATTDDPTETAIAAAEGGNGCY